MIDGVCPSPDVRPAASRNGWQSLAVCALLLLATGLVFGQTVRHEFINLDDNIYVYQNPHVLHGLNGQEILWSFAHSHFANWHPLTWISLMLDYQLYGLNAAGYHLTNVLLHAATAILLFLVLQQMTGALWPSAFVAALFAVHPMQVESVAWVTERKDVLSGLFFVLTLGAYLGYVRRPFSILRYLAVVALFALGLMAKAMLVTLPFLLLLLDYWPLGRMGSTPGATVSAAGNLRPQNLWRLILEKVPLFALAAVCCAATLWIQGESLAPNERVPLLWRIGNAAISYVVYLATFCYPAGLAVLYPPPSPDGLIWKVSAAGLVLASISAAALLARRRYPYLLVGWFWFLGMLVPVIGVVQVGLQTVADRFTYLPQIGLGIALAWGMADAACRWPGRRWVCVAAGSVMLAVFMGCAWHQASFWRDSESLWTHTLACTRPNSAAHNAFANALVDRGRLDDAVAHYRQAVDIRPDLAPAHYNLAVALDNLGRFEEAIAEYEQTLKLTPGDAKSHYNLGSIQLTHGQLERAIEHFQEAIRLEPAFAEAHYNLANAWFVRGRLEDAVEEYRETLKIRPNFANALYNLGLALANLRRWDDAIAEFRRALQVQPEFAEVHNSLGYALAVRGHSDEAVEHFRAALKIRPDFVEARENLNRVLAH